MEEPTLIGILLLDRYPVLELFQEFLCRIDNDLYEKTLRVYISKYIQEQYIKYIAHIIGFVLLATGVFISGYITYETILPLSAVLSVIFAGMFIYISRAREIKLAYFKSFEDAFTKEFNKYCIGNESFQFAFKKSRILIYIKKET